MVKRVQATTSLHQCRRRRRATKTKTIIKTNASITPQKYLVLHSHAVLEETFGWACAYAPQVNCTQLTRSPCRRAMSRCAIRACGAYLAFVDEALLFQRLLRVRCYQPRCFLPVLNNLKYKTITNKTALREQKERKKDRQKERKKERKKGAHGTGWAGCGCESARLHSTRHGHYATRTRRIQAAPTGPPRASPRLSTHACKHGQHPKKA